MTMMQNAIESIELGMEDFTSTDSRRLTSAIRNVAAGILLLLKCVLLDRSPLGSDGALIYQRIVPVTEADGTVTFRPKGKQTVDVQAIKERFESLGIEVDWKAFDKFSAIRNEVEHFYTRQPAALVREALSQALPLIQTILADNLGETAADVFSKECWATLREVKDIYDRQFQASQGTFNAAAWGADLLVDAVTEFRCTDCGSSLVRQIDPENEEVDTIELECADCKEKLERDEVLEAAIISSTANDPIWLPRMAASHRLSGASSADEARIPQRMADVSSTVAHRTKISSALSAADRPAPTTSYRKAGCAAVAIGHCRRSLKKTNSFRFAPFLALAVAKDAGKETPTIGNVPIRRGAKPRLWLKCNSNAIECSHDKRKAGRLKAQGFRL